MLAQAGPQGQARTRDTSAGAPLAILAIDTSTPTAALSLDPGDGPAALLRTDPAIRHGRTLLAAIRQLSADLDFPLGRLDRIAVGLGPGSYTGLRIGLTAARTLAYALGIPLVALDSLALLARNAPPEALAVAVLADAQRGCLYLGNFERAAAGGPLLPAGGPRIEPVEAWLEGLDPATVVLGPAAARLRPRLPAGSRLLDPDCDAPAPGPLCDLARAAVAASPPDALWTAEPLYLQHSAAEIKRAASPPIAPGAHPA